MSFWRVWEVWMYATPLLQILKFIPFRILVTLHKICAYFLYLFLHECQPQWTLQEVIDSSPLSEQ